MIWSSDIFEGNASRAISPQCGTWIWNIRKDERSLFVSAYENGGETDPPQEEAFILTPSGTVALLPALPELPTVLTLENPLTIVPGTGVSGYLVLPVSMQLLQLTGHGKTVDKSVLKEIPGITLSKTWFGTTVSGDLCYGWDTGLRMQLPRTGELEAVVPITMENNSQTLLVVDKICLHTEYLELFITADRLWTNEVEVKYRGEEQKSTVTLGEDSPDEASKYSGRIDPRKNQRRGFVVKTFDVIRQMTGIL